METEGDVSILEISCFEARWLSLTEVRKSRREDTAAGAAAEGGGGKDVERGGEVGGLGHTTSEVVAGSPDGKALHTPGNTAFCRGRMRYSCPPSASST